VLEAQELVGLDQPLERRLNQFLAFAHVVEDLQAEHKEAPVDPEVGIPARANPIDLPFCAISTRCRLKVRGCRYH
jgi:hypothetical protein